MCLIKRRISLYVVLQALKEGSVKWNHSKLMLVGEGRAGKTCTLRALLGKPFIDTASTVGLHLSACQIDRTTVEDWTEVAELGQQHERATARACAASMLQEMQRVMDEAELFERLKQQVILAYNCYVTTASMLFANNL